MADKERLERIIQMQYDGYTIWDMGEDDLVWLIEQAERVQELEQQNKRYREALEFYADEESYEPLEVQIGAVTKEGYKISKYKYDPKINTDKGKKARQALEGEE